MFKNKFYLRKVLAMAICLVGMTMFSGCDREKDPRDDNNENVPKQMTMTTANTKVRFQLRGIGTVSFDWGDGSPEEIMTFGVDVNDDGEGWYEFNHNYSSATSRTITISGDTVYALEFPAIQLLTLDVSKNPLLIYLNCSDNQLTELNISGLTNLDYLRCGYNQLTSIDVSQLVNLTYLSCGSNKLTSLDLSRLTKLDFLWSGYNPLSSLDVSKLTNLEDLDCASNQLTSLNLNGLTKLESLNCTNNLITSLNLSGNTKLKNLWSGYNKLSSLNVSGLIDLGYLECQNNYMNATALNALFYSLPTLEFGSTVWITNNGPNYDGTGSRDCDKTIAESKGWSVGLD